MYGICTNIYHLKNQPNVDNSCLFFGWFWFYQGKLPLNNHLGVYFYAFPTTGRKSQANNIPFMDPSRVMDHHGFFSHPEPGDEALVPSACARPQNRQSRWNRHFLSWKSKGTHPPPCHPPRKEGLIERAIKHHDDPLTPNLGLMKTLFPGGNVAGGPEGPERSRVNVHYNNSSPNFRETFRDRYMKGLWRKKWSENLNYERRWSETSNMGLPNWRDFNIFWHIFF